MVVHIIVVCLIGLSLYLVYCMFRGSPPPPPGPSGWPVIGNMLDVSTEAPFRTLGMMTSEYGPVIHLSFVGTRYVCLNSFKATDDLLVKKSAATSNKPHYTVGGDLVGWGNATAFLQYGDTHRRHRKFFGRNIGIHSRLRMLYPINEAEAKKFVLCVLKNPDDLVARCHRSFASLSLKINQGYTVQDDDDPLVEVVKKAADNIAEIMVPGRFVADFIPILQYLPKWITWGFHQDVKRWHTISKAAVNKPHDFVHKNLANGDAATSLMADLLREGLAPKDEEVMKWSSFSMYLGIFSTMSSILSGFFLAMTLYPDVLRKGQAEIDAVVGNDRLPTMEDRDSLPYVCSICTELLRWNVVFPSTPHITTEDILYEGYLIPKGSWLLPNIWFILSNPETYPSPEIFDPERFLGNDPQPDPRKACFGWGRRRCPGARLSESMIFIYVAMALSTLYVSRCVENGVECVPEYEFEEAMIRQPKPFKCKITARSKTVEDLLQE